MAGDVVLKVEHLSKKYCKALKRSMLYGICDIARDSFGIKFRSDRLRDSEFWAVDDVSFELVKGETLGIIGPNGSGKSTILKMLNGIFLPDKGKITLKGKIGALIEVGAGFHPMLTGRENIYINGAILGMGRREIAKKFDAIVDFADIGDFLDTPVKFYSSGMFVKLGFAVAVHCDPDILLVDEVLAVGDLKFQQKCFAKIGDIVKSGTAIVLVSHDMVSLQRVCTCGIVMDKGKVRNGGRVQEIVGDYFDLCRSDRSLIQEGARDKLVSSFGITYKEINFYDINGTKTRTFRSGDDIVAEWSFEMTGKLENVSVHFSLNLDSYSYNGYATHYDNIKIPYVDDKTAIRIRIKKPYLSPGDYIVSIGLWDENYMGSYFWDYHSTGTIRIEAAKKMLGRFEFDHEWEILRK